MKCYHFILSFLCSYIIYAFAPVTERNTVKNVTEFEAILQHVQSYDNIVLANGICMDAELLFEAHVATEKTITLTFEKREKAILSGVSNLNITGDLLIVRGLAFKNVHTTTYSIISFIKSRKLMTNNSHLTECVIDNFNNPERQVQDYLISIYGKNNRIDHNHITEKKNLDVTMIFGLVTKENKGTTWYSKVDNTIALNFGNSVIYTSKNSMIDNYKLFIESSVFKDIIIYHFFDVLRVSKSTFSDTISIQNSNFKNITGSIVAMDKETDDIGAYNIEHFSLKKKSFNDLQGAALTFYRGDKDESAFGPFLEVQHTVFEHVGYGSKNKYDATLPSYGVQEIDIKNNIFKDRKAIKVHLVFGEPIFKILNTALSNSEKLIVTGKQKYWVENQWQLAPKFSDDNNYFLTVDSPLKEKSADGEYLGLIHN